MTTEEVKKLTEIQYKIDDFNRDIRRLESRRLSIYIDGCELYYSKIPMLKENMLELLIARVTNARNELLNELNRLVICTSNTKTSYKPVNLIENE